ncbi:MAG: class I SAM-dependent methyltransferase [Thermoleophilaceae bacterium]
MEANHCEACGAEVGRLIEAREMMLGLRERFTYLECAECGHLQLVDVPRQLERYYPRDYYSLGSPPKSCRRPRGRLRRLASEGLLRLPASALRASHRGIPDPVFRQLAGLGLSTRSRICDVGAGGGDLLVRLWKRGFDNLTGVDPHLEDDREVAPSVWVRRQAVAEIAGEFDAILLNHSLEHMHEPVAVLSMLRERLAARGIVMVRVPLAGGLAWERYGADWVGLDPPRHLFVPTARSMGLLAERAGLRVVRMSYDSHALQFWGSEQYRRDIALHDERSWVRSPASSPFSRADIARWHAEAQRLNLIAAGDSGAFVLRAAD